MVAWLDIRQKYIQNITGTALIRRNICKQAGGGDKKENEDGTHVELYMWTDEVADEVWFSAVCTYCQQEAVKSIGSCYKCVLCSTCELHEICALNAYSNGGQQKTQHRYISNTEINALYVMLYYLNGILADFTVRNVALADDMRLENKFFFMKRKTHSQKVVCLLVENKYGILQLKTKYLRDVGSSLCRRVIKVLSA